MTKKYDWRKHKEELLGIEYPEDKQRKKIVAAMLRKKDHDLRKQEEEFWNRGFCPKCNIVKTPEGKCSARNTVLCS